MVFAVGSQFTGDSRSGWQCWCERREALAEMPIMARITREPPKMPFDAK
jgi:hypothetical protein